MHCRVGFPRSPLRQVKSCCWVILFGACARPAKPLVEDLTGHKNLSSFTLQQLRGTRDGDRLDAEASFGDGSSTIRVEMHFAIGVPTKLKSGRWEFTRDSYRTGGSVMERSVTFLGGQDGPPSIGGRFDLLNPAGVAEYRVTLPTTQLKVKLPLERDNIDRK
jgi:hypothetical protein